MHLNEATRLHFERMSPILGGEVGAAMKAALANPPPEAAIAAIARDPGYNSMMRTTCVATMVNAGHALNALPQKATANVNCRILPDESVEQTAETLARVIGDVWLCSGQSNMEWTLQNCDNAETAIADADQPQIRLLKIPKVAAPAPATSSELGVYSRGWSAPAGQ